MRVEVYRNLHKGAWSVRHQGKVIAHNDAVAVTDARLVVQPAGQARVRREGKKFVHAFVRGERSWVDNLPVGEWRTLTYNPYVHDTFVDAETQEPVRTATVVLLTPHGKAHYLP